MLEKGKDKENPLNKRAVPTEEFSRIRRIVPVNYSEEDLSASDTDSENAIVGSESGFGRIKLETEEEQAEAQWALLQDTWTPQNVKKTATQVGLQSNRIAEENIPPMMTREAEKKSVDKILELMMTIRIEDQKRSRRERKKKKENERKDRSNGNERKREGDKSSWNGKEKGRKN